MSKNFSRPVFLLLLFGALLALTGVVVIRAHAAPDSKGSPLRKVVANLDGFSRVHGVWAVPELGRVYASVTGKHKVAVVDMKTLQTLVQVGPINYPDGLAYVPTAKRVFVSD